MTLGLVADALTTIAFLPCDAEPEVQIGGRAFAGMLASFSTGALALADLRHAHRECQP